MRGRTGAVIAVVAVGLAAVAGLVSGAGASRDGQATVALLLPEGKAARYETQDRPYFEERVRHLCPTCRVAYANAGANPARQLSQVEAALANRVDAIVLDPVDARSAVAAAIRAEKAGVPLVAYDRLIDDRRVDWYVGFDGEAVGRLQAGLLAEAIAGRTGGVVMVNGAPSDPNAAEFRRGASAELRRRGVRVITDVAIENWDPARARSEMTRALARHGADGIAGVYVANDSMAGAVVDAFDEAGVAVPPITGQDAELDALRRILAGRQTLTVYKPLRDQAWRAAEAAVALAGGRTPGPPPRLPAPAESPPWSSTRCRSATPTSPGW